MTHVDPELITNDRSRRFSVSTRFTPPELTAEVNGPSWRVTGFHYPSTRAVLTGARWRVMETGHPSIRAV